MMSIFCILVLICVSISFSLCEHRDEGYAVVVDAGSTGSRTFVFKFYNNDLGNRTIESVKGQTKIPGLSSFAQNPEEAIDYILPMLLDAETFIPEIHLSSTNVYIRGTAGMRLLTEDEQERLWLTLAVGLKSKSELHLIVSEDNMGTIDGYSEAFYGVLSANYVAGSIDGNLRAVPGKTMVGALDMGGSSTQLIFNTGSKPGTVVSKDDFWSYSWLNFGVERVKDKVFQYLIEKAGISYEETIAAAAVAAASAKANSVPKVVLTADGDVDPFSSTTSTSTKKETEDSVVVIDNPCSFVGHEIEAIPGIVFRGTGGGEGCIKVVSDILWPEGNCEQPPCFVDGVEHPPVNGEFYGMSVYFYALDCIRHLGPAELHAWPNPTIDELKHAVYHFCAANWTTVEEEMLGGKHKYTRDDQLPYRCLEGVYITTLLEHGFGFDGAHRNITLALEVRGNEVEWSLGFALSEVPLPPNTSPASERALLSSSTVLTGFLTSARSISRVFKSIFSPLVAIFALFRSKLRFN